MQKERQKVNGNLPRNKESIIICPLCKKTIPSLHLIPSKTQMGIQIKCNCTKNIKTMPLAQFLKTIDQISAKLAKCTVHNNQETYCTICLPNFQCVKHKTFFEFYCCKCKLDICIQCKPEHKYHNWLPLKFKHTEPPVKAIYNIIDQNNNTLSRFLAQIDKDSSMTQWKEILKSAYELNESINYQLIELNSIICRTIKTFANSPIYALKKLEQKFELNLNYYNKNCRSFEENVKTFLKYLETTFLLVKAKASECVGTLSGHTAPILFHCQLRDGRLATTSEDNTIRFWNISTNQCTDVITKFNQRITLFVELKNGAFVFIYKEDKLKISHPKKNEGFLIFIRKPICTGYMQVLKDDFVAIDLENGVNIINIPTRQIITILKSESHVASIKELRNGGLILKYCSRKYFTLSNKYYHYSVKVENTKKVVGPILELTDGRIVFGVDEVVDIWIPKTNKYGEKLKGHKHIICYIFELNNGKLYSQSLECIFLWDIKTLRCLVKLKEFVDLIIFPKQLRDGRIACIADKEITFWKIE